MVGLATGLAGPPMFIFMGAFGLLNPIEILVMRGGGGGAGTSSGPSSQSSACLWLLSEAKINHY